MTRREPSAAVARLRVLSIMSVLSVMPLCVASADTGLQYAYDDGTGSGNNGYSPLFNPGQYLWGNVFSVQGGFNTITSVSVAFGNIAAGRSVSLLVFQLPTDFVTDPRGDGLTLLSTTQALTANTNLTNQGQNIFNEYAITPTVVSGNFYVAALMNLVGGETPGRFDNGGVANGDKSWVFVDGTINLANLSTAPIGFNLAAPNFPRAAFMVRANAVPAPTGGVLLGVVGLVMMRRRGRG